VTPQQRIQLVIILIFVGSGVIRWIFQRLQEQAAKKRALDATEQRRLEALRTGRNLEPIQTQAAGPDREQVESGAAAKRRAQIEEFRRRQQERAAQRSQSAEATRLSRPGPVATGPMTRIPGSAGPTVPMPARKPPRPQAPPTAATKPKPRPVPSARVPVAAKPAPQPVAAAAVAPQPQPVRRLDLDITAPQTPEQWRRAIVINTILAPAPGLTADPDPRLSSF
jgi:hypothetical protein